MPTYKPQSPIRLQSEDAIQAETFLWHWNTFRHQRKQLFMVYNNAENKIKGSILKGMGMVRGVSDLIYFAADGTVWCMECKLPGETQSDDQKEFEHLVKAFGHHYHIFHSREEFHSILSNYLL